MNTYKAYKHLFNKTMKYKNIIRQYESLAMKSDISKPQLDKMVKDQSFIMNSINKMQNHLVKRDVLKEQDKVPTTPVIDNKYNIDSFNNNIRNQITNILSKSGEELNSELNSLNNDEKVKIKEIMESNNNNNKESKINNLITFKKNKSKKKNNLE